MGRQMIPKHIRDVLPKECCNCGSTEGLVYHHIVPFELGGRDIPSNIAVVCSVCHGLIHYGKRGAINHGDLVRKAMQEARGRGVKLGKPCADYETVMRLIAAHSTQYNLSSEMTEKEIMVQAGVKPTCYYKCKQMLEEAIAADKWPYSWKKPQRVRDHPTYERVVKRNRGANFLAENQ